MHICLQLKLYFESNKGRNLSHSQLYDEIFAKNSRLDRHIFINDMKIIIDKQLICQNDDGTIDCNSENINKFKCHELFPDRTSEIKS